MGALILHGWTYSTEKYKKIARLLTNRGINTKILKVPGLTEKIDRPWTIDDYVEWLKNKIAESHDSFEVDSDVILIGHSNGGRLALNFAVKYPNIIDRLILIDSAGVYHDDLVIRSKRFVFNKIAKIGKKLSSSEKLRKLLYKLLGESDYKNASPIMKQTMLNLINSDISLSLDKISVTTLIIWGKEDKITPLSDGKLMNKLIKNSKLHIIDSAKHSPQFTHAEIVVNRIYEELTSRHSGDQAKPETPESLFAKSMTERKILDKPE